MNSEDAPQLSLINLCRGAALEIFDRELGLVLDNIHDINCDAEQKRTIVLEVDFHPYRDRTGAKTVIKCKAKLAGMEPVEGNAFIIQRHGEMIAVPYDPRQEELFNIEPQEVRKK